MSVAPKDVNENQIQFALERGVPAMVATFATRRLLYPSQAFDLIHCSRCRVNSTRDGQQIPKSRRVFCLGSTTSLQARTTARRSLIFQTLNSDERKCQELEFGSVHVGGFVQWRWW
ncbi:putative S-adenosyl-L-methionine-dependent methyltransferase [Helianthus annuus]|nr:putative S-adenosyl-L-methionine-dependent methyltransferase [Helianthus annuus]KAJ0867148.1 putative S-adenosyl-L-methionine-dependent methyltransferase [Helianthus annuus]